MNGINLHHVVRGAITAVHPDEPVKWYQNNGAQNVGGILKPAYTFVASVPAQVQSESDDALAHADRAGMNTDTVRAYLYFDDATPPPNLDRFKAKGGDIFQRADNSYWLVTALIDNFSDVGWLCVRAVRQVNAPEIEVNENA